MPQRPYSLAVLIHSQSVLRDTPNTLQAWVSCRTWRHTRSDGHDGRTQLAWPLLNYPRIWRVLFGPVSGQEARGFDGLSGNRDPPSAPHRLRTPGRPDVAALAAHLGGAEPAQGSSPRLGGATGRGDGHQPQEDLATVARRIPASRDPQCAQTQRDHHHADHRRRRTQTSCGRWTSSSTPPAMGACSRSRPWSTSTPVYHCSTSRTLHHRPDLIAAIDRVVTCRGLPKVIRADNGPELVCQALQEYCALHRAGTTLVERIRRIVQQSLPRRMPEPARVRRPDRSQDPDWATSHPTSTPPNASAPTDSPNRWTTSRGPSQNVFVGHWRAPSLDLEHARDSHTRGPPPRGSRGPE